MKLGIYTSSWNYSEYEAETIAATFDMSQSWYNSAWHPDWDYSAKMNQVHALNPNYKFLMYRNCMSIPDYLTDEWNYADSQGWLLKDINGSYVTEGWVNLYAVDITNPAYQQWLAAKVKSLLDLQPFDGVYADNCLKYSAAIFDAAFKTRPINPRTVTYFTDIEILDGCAGMLNAIIDAIGTSKLLMPNGVWNGAIWWNTWFGGDNYRYILSKVPRLNCLGSEGTFRAYNDQWYSESIWKNSVDFVVWVQDNFLSGHPERCFSATCISAISAILPPGATVEQVILYGFCSMLLAIKYSPPQNTIDFAFSQQNLPNASQLQLLQTLRSVDMLEPLSNYYKIADTPVYTRDFRAGKVLINPTDTTYQVTLPRAYKTLDEQTVSTLTMSPHTGVLLFELFVTPEPPKHLLSVTSTPIVGFEFHIDSVTYKTPFAEQLNPGTYILEMPANVMVEWVNYVFRSWKDGPTSSVREVTLEWPTSLEALYEAPPPPPPEKGNLDIHAYHRTREVEAEFGVEGTGVEGTTPQVVTLNPGRYAVRGTYGRETETVEAGVVSDQTVKVELQFLRPAMPLPNVRSLLPWVSLIMDRRKQVGVISGYAKRLLRRG